MSLGWGRPLPTKQERWALRSSGSEHCRPGEQVGPSLLSFMQPDNQQVFLEHLLCASGPESPQ